MWWALQTVTTVGYGDVTPKNTSGRFVATLSLMEAIGFVTIVTAVITSSFVERARQQRVADTETAQAVGPEQLACPALGGQLEAGTDRGWNGSRALDLEGSAGATHT